MPVPPFSILEPNPTYPNGHPRQDGECACVCAHCQNFDSWLFVKRTFLEFVFVFGFDTVCNAVLTMGKPLEVLLMPGLAFDGQGHRLGRGGGYASVYALTGNLQPQEFCSHLTFVLASSCLSNCSVCVLSVCHYVCLSVYCMSVCWLSVSLSVCLCILCLYFGCLSVCLSFCLSLGLCFCLYTSVFLSVSLCTHLCSVVHFRLSHPSCPACKVPVIGMHNFVSYPDAVSIFW